jgi:hypothetical protein
MAVDFRRTRIYFDSTRFTEQIQTGAVVFPTTVNRAEAAINGFFVKFDNGDKHLLAHKIDIGTPRINGATVFFEVNYLLRDSSGNIDDPYSGYVDVMVVADRV